MRSPAARSGLSLLLLATLLTATGHVTGATAAPEPLVPSTEVWQVAEPAYAENPTNPLAGRVWGVYQGPQDQVSGPFLRARGNRATLLAKIGLRPRTKWFGGWVPDSSIRSTVEKHIVAAQDGDPDKLVQIAVFRMKPWEQEGCTRRSTPAEKRSYRRWINQLAAGIADTPMLVVMQPDGPFLWCVPDRAAKSRLLTYATRTLSALPRTSVYIDAGAADWCQNGYGADPERCAALLERTGIEYARGFALDSTHYNGPDANIAQGASIVEILQRDGYGDKHFILDTAKSGRPMVWSEVIPARKGDLKDNARVCRTATQTRCVTLGIPPTVRTADAEWGLTEDNRTTARRYVDGFVWFGRPWLYNQADPFVMKRAIAMARSTPWPGPLLPTP